MREVLKFILDLLAEIFGGIRERENSVAAKEQIADARERADQIVDDARPADLAAELERLHQHGRSRGAGGGTVGQSVSDSEERTDPHYHG